MSDKSSVGIGNKKFSEAELVGKMGVKVCKVNQASWKDIIGAKYGILQGGWITKEIRHSNGSAVCKFLCSIWEQIWGKLNSVLEMVTN